MIKILCDYEFVEISGHSGTAEAGKDIVCAGVSALANTAASLMWDEPTVRDGYLLIRYRNSDIFESCYINFMMAGLRQIADEYPDAVTIDDLRVG